MTFPSDKDIEFFSQPEVRKFFGERWESCIGDWYIETEQNLEPWGYETEDMGIIAVPCFALEPEVYGEPRGKPLHWQPNREPQILYISGLEMVHGVEPFNKDEMGKAWLPRPDQLMEMLEEKVALGDLWFELRGPTFSKGARYILDIDTGLPEEKRQYVGPTLAVALGKALMGAIKESNARESVEEDAEGS